MNNFLRKNRAHTVDEMYGKEVYFTLFPDEQKPHLIYRGILLGYGAYGLNPEHKTFCVYVDRGDMYRFVDYFRDECFVTKEEFQNFKREEKEKCHFSLNSLVKIARLEEDYIAVKVKVGGMIYPVCGIEQQAKSVKSPAFVLKVNMNDGEKWAIE